MTRSALRLGIDLGTSAIKAVAIDDAGTAVASSDSPYPTHADLPGQAEQEPSHWLQAAATAVGNIGSQLGPAWPAKLASIGLTGQLPTLVCLGENGALGRAIAWTDSRADQWATERLDRDRRRHFYRQTGMPIDGRYLAPMFQFHWQARRSVVRRILSAKDFLCFALTGRAVTDPSTAAGYGVYGIADKRWDPALCAFWELDPQFLPEIAPANTIAGPLNAAGSRLLGLPEGLPVFVGAADSVAGALAMGGLAEGSVSIVMGSSTIVIATGREALLDPEARYLLTPHALEGWYGREMDLLSTGTGFRWLCGLLGWNAEQFEVRAQRSPPGANGLCFSPYLAGGEQGALWNPALRGVLHGLTLQHDPADIARAFLEGVYFEIRRCLDVLSDSSPAGSDRSGAIVLSGHAAENPGLMRMLADVLDRPVRCFTHRSPSAIGAALLGFGNDAGSLATTTAQTAARAEPGPAASAYDRLYRRYLGLFPRIAEAPSDGSEVR
ncbi:xylulokinase [Hypericibacter sp.]|uniref:xylulokinase n=1 Tax=Hypericibacter sp. TaxID=2705401 RepID=UPI003D6D8352